MKIQSIQEVEYNFPYHYIPEYRDGFSQIKAWNWALNYICTMNLIIKDISGENGIKSIADIGCGDGRLSRELSHEFSDVKIVGIDYSQKAINLAKAMNPALDFYCLDINRESINQKFDAVTLVEVLEHIPVESINNFIDSITDCLNDNGLLYITVPHKNKDVSEKHFQHFDSITLKDLFYKNFEVEALVFIDRRTRFVKIIKNIMINRLFILNNQTINNLIYDLYQKLFFYTDEKKCERIYIKLRKRLVNE